MDVRWAFELFEEEVCHIQAADGELAPRGRRPSETPYVL